MTRKKKTIIGCCVGLLLVIVACAVANRWLLQGEDGYVVKNYIAQRCWHKNVGQFAQKFGFPYFATQMSCHQKKLCQQMQTHSALVPKQRYYCSHTMTLLKRKPISWRTSWRSISTIFFMGHGLSKCCPQRKCLHNGITNHETVIVPTRLLVH